MKRFLLVRKIVVTVMFVICACVASWAQARGQLYFVTGLATPKYTIQVPSSVFAVNPAIQISTKVTDLVDHSQGSDFVVVDHDHRVDCR